MRILFFFLLLISISANAQITGSWTANTQGETMSLILNADGTGVLDGERLRYKAQDGTLSVTITGESTTNNYNYSLNGNSLTVSGGDLDEPINFKRVGKPSQAPPPSANNSIIGAWSGNGENMEFKSDGNCTYSGHSFKYAAENGQLKLFMPEGLIAIPYTIKNGKLIINVGGQDYTYGRGTNAQQPLASGPRSVPQELTGKWCWVDVTNTSTGGTSSDACITLNADGTYDFYSERSMSATNQAFSAGTNSATSDRGTWWVQGQRIYYNSESRGPGSYSLQKRNHPKNVNDPMIVLDGQPFVTQTQKAPWR
jgi:hypothetical protein